MGHPVSYNSVFSQAPGLPLARFHGRLQENVATSGKRHEHQASWQLSIDLSFIQKQITGSQKNPWSPQRPASKYYPRCVSRWSHKMHIYGITASALVFWLPKMDQYTSASAPPVWVDMSWPLATRILQWTGMGDGNFDNARSTHVPAHDGRGFPSFHLGNDHGES